MKYKILKLEKIAYLFLYFSYTYSVLITSPFVLRSSVINSLLQLMYGLL